MPRPAAIPAPSDWVSEPCAVCGTGARDVRAGRHWQMKCLSGAHWTRAYPERRSAVMAWNLNQRHKRSQGKPHG